MVDVVEEIIDDEQAEMHIWPPTDFCGLGIEHALPTHPIFEPCPLNANVARWWNGHSLSHLTVIEYTVLDHCGLMRLNPESLPERGVSLMSKRSSLKRENYFVVVLSPMTLSPYTAQMFPAASAVFAPLLNSEELRNAITVNI